MLRALETFVLTIFLQVRQWRLNNLPKVMQLEVAELRGQPDLYDFMPHHPIAQTHSSLCLNTRDMPCPAIVALANQRELLSCWGVRTFPPPVL